MLLLWKCTNYYTKNNIWKFLEIDMATGVVIGYHSGVDIMTLGHRQLPLEVFWFSIPFWVNL